MCIYKIISPFLEEDYYNELADSFPAYEVIARGREGDNKLFQRSAKEVLGAKDIPQIWQDFFWQMIREFPARVEEMFDVSFPKDRAIRGTEKAEFNIDVQFAVNSQPVDNKRVRGPHVDNPVEGYACCFYFGHPDDDSGGDLILYEWTQEPKFVGKAEIEDERVREIDRCRYGPNRGVAFLNDINAIHGVGPLTTLAFVLIIEDPHRFKKSRQVGAFVGLCPRRYQSGSSDPQLHISKAGDRELRRLLVNAANYILGPFGRDSELRSWGQAMAARGGNTAKRRAVVAAPR